MKKIFVLCVFFSLLSFIMCACNTVKTESETTTATETATAVTESTAPVTTTQTATTLGNDETEEGSKEDDGETTDEDKTTTGSDNVDEETTVDPASELTDRERELIYGALGDDFEFEGFDELSSRQESKIRHYAEDYDITVKFDEGRMILTDEDGNELSEPIEWPDNALMQLLPIPEFGKVTQDSGNETEYAVTLTGFSSDNIVEYAKAIQAAGFSESVEEIGSYDTGIYNFTAKKSDGCTVNMSMVTTENLVITVKAATTE